MQLNTTEAQIVHKIIEESSLKKFFDLQARGIDTDDFTEDTPRESWEFLKSFVRRYNRLPSLETVQEQVPTFTPAPVPENIDFYIDKISNQVRRHKLANFTQELATKIQRDDQDTLDFIGTTYTQLIKVANVNDYGRFIDMPSRTAEYERRVAAGETPFGIPTGIEVLDNHFMGFRPGDYGVIAGRLGEGKTTVALFMAYSAFMANYKVSYITLEMPREQIFEKLDALATRIPINKIKRLNLTESELNLYKAKAEEIAQHQDDSDIRIHDRTGECTPTTIEAILNQDQPDILFIDQISLMKVSRHKANWEGIKEASREIKQLALRYRRPIVVLSQLNRQAEEIITQGGLPTAAQLSYSDAVGQDADHAFVLASTQKSRHFKAKRFASIKLRGASEIDLMLKWDPKTNWMEYMDHYNRVIMPDRVAQEIQQAQENYMAGSDPFDA